MNKADLISRQAAIMAVQEHYNNNGFHSYADGQVMLNRINDLPTIEAEPVRKGSWVGIDDFPHEVWECDRCGNIIEGDRTNYCDYCGAKMDEVKE